MLKTSLRKKKNPILKSFFFLNELCTKIYKSFSRNKFIFGTDRLTYLIKNNNCYNYFTFFFSYQKLLCFYTTNYKVSTKKYNMSRFFFNYQFSKLILANTHK